MLTVFLVLSRLYSTRGQGLGCASFSLPATHAGSQPPQFSNQGRVPVSNGIQSVLISSQNGLPSEAGRCVGTNHNPRAQRRDVRLLLMEQLRRDRNAWVAITALPLATPPQTHSFTVSVCALESEVVVTVDGGDGGGRGGSLLELVSTQHLAYQGPFAILSIEHWD